jgi:hypothetical protein
MQLDQVIDVSSSESDGEQPRDRREIYEPVVRQVVDALGGCEGVSLSNGLSSSRLSQRSEETLENR